MRRTSNVEAVLSVLLEGPNHGLEIAKRTNLNHPTVYRVLARLLDEGWTTAEESGITVVHTVTEAGREGAAAWLSPSGEEPIRVRRRADYVRVIRWTGGNLDAVLKFVGPDASYEDGVLIITTPDTREHCAVGDWIIQGVNNFWRVSPQEFQIMFEVS